MLMLFPFLLRVLAVVSPLALFAVGLQPVGGMTRAVELPVLAYTTAAGASFAVLLEEVSWHIRKVNLFLLLTC